MFGSSSASASQSTCTSRNVPQYIPSSLSEVSPNSFGNELQSNSPSDNDPQYLTSLAAISIFHTVSSSQSVSFSTNAPKPSLSSPSVPTHISSSTTMVQPGFPSAKVSWYNSPSDHVIRYISYPVSVSLKISNPLTNSLDQSRSSSANAYMHSHTSFSGNVAQQISSSSSTFQSTPSSVHLTPHIAASVKVSLSSSTWAIVPQYISSSTSMFRSVSSSANEAAHISSVAIFHSSSSLVTGGSQSVSAASKLFCSFYLYEKTKILRFRSPQFKKKQLETWSQIKMGSFRHLRKTALRYTLQNQRNSIY